MDRTAAKSVLARNSWFASLAVDLQADILRLGRTRYMKNAVIFAVGDAPNGLFAVLSGKVQISHTSSDGRLALLMMAESGAWFGETSLLDGGTRNSDALAVGRVELFHLDVFAFREMTRDSSQRYAAFVRLLCDHFRLAMDHFASLRMPAEARIAQRLLFFSRTQANNGEPGRVVNLSQEQLASNVGISRQALNSHLRRLEEQGLVKLGYSEIRLCNHRALVRLAQNALAAYVPGARAG